MEEMSKEKQIYEIAEVVCRTEFEPNCETCYFKDKDCRSLIIAEDLYNAGYRKQSEGEWIWVKEHSNYKCSLCGEYDTTTPKFCRECGAKMKG